MGWKRSFEHKRRTKKLSSIPSYPSGAYREYIVKEWAYTIPSDYLYENYPVKIATMLHRIELDYIVNGEVTDSRLKWAKENIPSIQRPYAYFQPCIEWLGKNGIKFMEVLD